MNQSINGSVLVILIIISQGNGRSTFVYELNKSFCPKDVTKDAKTNSILTWPKTKAEEVQIPDELCLDWGTVPITRRCNFNKTHGAFWSSVKGDCNIEHNLLRWQTKQLYNLRRSNETEKIILGKLISISNSFYKNIDIADVVFTKDILKGMHKLSAPCINIYDNLMLSKSEDEFVIETSENLFKSNTELLSIFPKYVDENEVNIEKSTITVVSTNLSNSNLIGWGLGQDYKIVNLYENQNEKDIHQRVRNDELHLAAYINENTRKKLQQSDRFPDMQLKVAFFFKFQFFIHAGQNFTYLSPVIYSQLKGFHGNLNLLTVVRKTEYENEECQSWVDGRWVKTPKQLMTDNLSICEIQPLGYYSFKKAFKPYTLQSTDVILIFIILVLIYAI